MEKKRFGLIGEHLGHSFSPAIHAMLGEYAYKLYELTPERVGPFLREGAFDGLNVTIPYKKTVMEFCTALSPAARSIGSVNTIIRRPDGTLYGDNTDYDGFCYLLRSAGAEVRSRKAVVLGSGGASLTVRAVLRDLGAGAVVTISRTGPDNYENLDRHADAELVVNTTPVGMYPNTGVSPVDLKRFPRCRGAFDLIYNPARTKFLLDAERLGIPCANGLGMLTAQAKAAAERFLEQTIPDEKVAEITGAMERKTRNILLIGMPGSGKSTVGAELARRLGRELADTDALVEQRAGCSIPELFSREGEEAFRRLEHEVLEEITKQSGLVIATGGGAVTRTENHDLLRQNSFVVYRFRPLSQLPTDGRPLSQAHSLAELFRQRAPLYEGLADLTVEGSTAEEAADLILRRLQL